MRGGNRRFYRGIINHIYQIAIEGDVIFYSISDHLVYFTIFFFFSRKHGIRVLKLCQMPDHIHGSLTADKKSHLSAFERDTTAVFAREHNGVCHRKGPFFKSPFGSVPKYGDKKARSNLIYVDNNPVERRITPVVSIFLIQCLSGCSGHWDRRRDSNSSISSSPLIP